MPLLPGVAANDADRLTVVATAWLAWCDDSMTEGGANAAWQPETLDYSFQVSTGPGPSPTTLEANGHRGGSLDWHAFDARPVAQPTGSQLSHSSLVYRLGYVSEGCVVSCQGACKLSIWGRAALVLIRADAANLQILSRYLRANPSNYFSMGYTTDP